MYIVDESYFEKINTKEKAYWLGFIYADGSLKNNSLIIQIKDFEHLQTFKDEVSFTGPISVVYGSGYNPDAVHHRLAICRKKFIEPIFKIGRYFNPMIIPDLDHDLIKYFILGYFDGDGSVWVSRNSSIVKGKRYIYEKIGFAIIADLSFCNDLSLYFNDIGIKTSIKKSKSENMYYVTFSGKKSSKIFQEHFYSDGLYCLNRKKEIVEHYNGPSTL